MYISQCAHNFNFSLETIFDDKFSNVSAKTFCNWKNELQKEKVLHNLSCNVLSSRFLHGLLQIFHHIIYYELTLILVICGTIIAL